MKLGSWRCGLGGEGDVECAEGSKDDEGWSKSVLKATKKVL